MNGKSGLFPSNFVKEIESTEETETSDVTDEPGTAQLISERACPYTKTLNRHLCCLVFYV